MHKFTTVLVAFVIVFVMSFGVTLMIAGDTQAKPNDCLLTIEPFYYCEASPSCHEPGEMKCWLCQGWDMYGEPCLCSRAGCMVPPQ